MRSEGGRLTHRAVRFTRAAWPRALSLAALVPLLREPPSLTLPYLLVVGLTLPGALAVGLLGTRAGYRYACQWLAAHDRVVLGVTVGVYFLAGYVGALVVYAGFGMGLDLHIFVQAAENTLQGRFGWIATWGPGPLWALHFQPVFLLLVASYAVFPTPWALLFWQSLMLAISAIPYYLLVRRWLPALPGLILTWAYLLLPGLFSQHFDDFQLTPFAAAPFLLALLFYEKQRWWAFIATYAVTSTAINEWLGLALSGIALLALVQRRSARWVMGPVLLSAAWFVFVSLLVLPYFRAQAPFPDFGDVSASRYRELGPRASELGERLAVDLPGTGAAFGDSSHFHYLRDLFAPSLFAIPFASPRLLLALPEVLKNLGADADIVRTLTRHHSVIASVALAVAAADGVARLARRFSWPPRVTAAVSCLTLVFAATAPATVASFAFVPYSWRVPQDALREAVAMVPPGASVAAPARSLSHLTRQWEIYFTDLGGTAEAVGHGLPEWVIYSEEPQDWAAAESMGLDREALRADLGQALLGAGYALQWEREGVRVYRRLTVAMAAPRMGARLGARNATSRR